MKGWLNSSRGRDPQVDNLGYIIQPGSGQAVWFLMVITERRTRDRDRVLGSKVKFRTAWGIRLCICASSAA